MSFLSPEYFWLFIFLVAGYLKKDFKGLSLTAIGYILTFVFIVLALSRPVIQREPLQSEQILNDIVIAVDLSYSMQATDIKPSRLKKAKEILKELIKNNKKSRFGIVAFTTNAIILSPMSEDSQLLEHLFNSLDENLIITKGSSIMPALKLSRKLSKSKKLHVVILSDGGDKTNYEQEAKFAKENSLIIDIFMLATKIGTSLELDDKTVLKDEIGNIVISRENSAIELLAQRTGGIYTKDFNDLLAALHVDSNNDTKVKTTIVRNFELFYIFIFLAIISFLVSVTNLKKFVLAYLVLFGINLDASFFNNSNIDEFKKANSFYREGKYEKSFQSYERVKSPDIKFKSQTYFNMANSLVRLKKFKMARENYIKSLTLFYSKEAYENLLYIQHVEEEMQMNTAPKKSNNNSTMAKKDNSKKNKKEGGSSNMKVSAASSNGSDNSKKRSSSSKVNLNSTKAKLSSKQYELINKGGVSEKQPW